MTRVPPVGFLIFFPTTVALFIYGLAGNWPWLISENARFELWELPVVWEPIAIAMLLFLEYGFSQTTGKPLYPKAYDVTFIAFLIAAACEGALAGHSIIEETLAHSRAVRAPAEIVSGHSRRQPEGHRRYTLTCSFVDQRGKRHLAWFSDVSDGIPARVQSAIDTGRSPATKDVAYDPQWPGRNWLADVPYSHDNRLFIFSLMALLFSLPLAGGLAVFRRWMPWLPTPRVAPFLGATWMLVMAAAIQGW
ncbi:MAG TPA: DUF3592 domain-containing protein [Tepidisphaeraceae bacterium]|jgi:hypothetical protein